MDITADILETAKTGAKKTEIMYKAKLSYKLLQTYLKRLVDEGLLEESRGMYFTSEIGKTFLETYKGLTKPALEAVKAEAVKAEESVALGSLTEEFLRMYRKLMKE